MALAIGMTLYPNEGKTMMGGGSAAYLVILLVSIFFYYKILAALAAKVQNFNFRT